MKSVHGSTTHSTIKFNLIVISDTQILTSEII